MSRPANERAFTGALVRLARLYRRALDQTLAVHGVSDARALPLLYIERLGDGVRQRALAEEMGIEGPSLVGLLDALSAAGLVERRPDPTDRRGKTLHLTESGRALAGVVDRALDAFRASLLSGVSDDDLAATVRLLAAFEQALSPSPDPGRAPAS